MRKEKWLPLIPALWVSLFDIGITIFSQKKEYWNGNLTEANEGNPIGAAFMEQHVLGLFIISLVWIVLIVVLGYYLPRKIAKVFLVFCLIAHSYGASTWLYNHYGFWVVMLFILLNAILYSFIDDLISSSKQE